MSKYKIGDKVYLEGKISEYDENDNTYHVDYSAYCERSQTSCWIKEEVLHTTDDDYNKGLNDAWELAKKIVLSEGDGGYSCEELENIFGYRSPASVLKVFTPQKVKAYEDERNKITVGDVVRLKYDHVVESIVTRITKTNIYRLFKDGSCSSSCYREDLIKTGRHFDSIDEFMRSAD